MVWLCFATNQTIMSLHQTIPYDIIFFLRSQYNKTKDDYFFSLSGLSEIVWGINWSLDPLGNPRREEDYELFRNLYAIKSQESAYSIIRSSRLYKEWLEEYVSPFNPSCIQDMKQLLRKL